MEEIIGSILEAEKIADDIVKNAADNAKNILIYAENNADEIREKAITEFKSRRKEVLRFAEEQAEKLYAERVGEGRIKAEKTVLSAVAKKEAAAEKILKEIIG